MHDVHSLSHTWHLNNVQELTSTDTATLYTVTYKNQPAILKVFNSHGWEDEKFGVYCLDRWNSNGSVKLLHSSEGAILLEKLFLPNLTHFSSSNSELQACEVFCDIIKKIHISPSVRDRNSLHNLSNLFQQLLDKTAPPGLENRMEKAFQISQKLLQTTTREVILHGDLHHENVMKNALGDWVCLDPKGFIGDPCYELGTVLKNPWDYPEVSQSKDQLIQRTDWMCRKLNLDFKRVLKFTFCHLCLSTLWAFEDQKKWDHQNTIANIIEPQL